jgi:DNA-binding CsgD family transcriptional regulator
VLHGRDRELAAVAHLIDEAWAARGGALVIRGEPGVGKSALLAEASRRAEGMQVLRTQGIESESPLAFAALQRLLRPVMQHAGRLPAPQARALRAAFGEEVAEEGADRFLVFLAALSLVAEAAEQGPVFAVVDDAHWLDDASSAALLFVARRLQVERVALLFGARDGDVRRFDSGDLPSLVMGGIDPESAAALLAERAGVAIPAEVRDRLMSRTGGNPLALVELPDALSTDELAGATPLPAQLPLTQGVERVFLDRCSRLSDDAQTFLLVVAADDSGRIAVVRQAAGALGAGESALEAVENSGLVRVNGTDLELRHPLVRSAVYGAATSLQRRRAHAALADALADVSDADRRAWHLAASVEEPDSSVVDELDATAERARARGGHEAAAAAWERAAELSSDVEGRAARLHSAGMSAWFAGQPTRARSLAEAARANTTDPVLSADIDNLRARIEWNTGSPQIGHRIMVEAAREVAPHDLPRARHIAMVASALATFGADASGDGQTFLPPVGDDDPESAHCIADLLAGFEHIRHGDLRAAAPLVRKALSFTNPLPDTDLVTNLGIAAMFLGDDEAAVRMHRMVLNHARDIGAVVVVMHTLTLLSLPEIAMGRWSTASAEAGEALHLALGTGHVGLTEMPMACSLLLAALRGNEESYAVRLAELETLMGAKPAGVADELTRDVLRWARALHATARPTSALHQLEQISSAWVRGSTGIDRIETAVRADRRELALQWSVELEDFGEATGASWALAAAAHGRALLEDGPAAERFFKSSLEYHAVSARIFDRARTQLAYGEFLRRSRRRVDARAELRAALEIFEDLGAAPWAERASSELRASGETARRRDPSSVSELTSQELQVARFVSEGLSNREVAAKLFLSPRTIDFHLRNIFAKVGVSSRGELTRLQLQ